MAWPPPGPCLGRMVGAGGSGSSQSLSRPMSTAWRTACSGWPSICWPGGMSHWSSRPRRPGPRPPSSPATLARPFVRGARGMVSPRQLRLPTVAVYQTDVPGYARAYRLGAAAEAAAWHWVRRIHNAADRTLAPSTASAERLRAHGIQRVWLWGRGVDCQRFNPAHRSESLRRSLAPRGEVLVGYVGRLANEKRVDLLAPIAEQPGTRLIIVGGGPAEERLRPGMPAAVFLGQHRGEQLGLLFSR